MISNLKKNKKPIIYSFVLLVVVIVSFSILKHSRALGIPIFGGIVTVSYPCLCSPGTPFFVTVSSPVGGNFFYYEGTQEYLNYNLPMPEIWALGLYKPVPDVCYQPGDPCEPVAAVIGTISPIVGTSLSI